MIGEDKRNRQICIRVTENEYKKWLTLLDDVKSTNVDKRVTGHTIYIKMMELFLQWYLEDGIIQETDAP